MIAAKDYSRHCVTSISARTEILRDEITLIQYQEQLYRSAARHALVDEMARAFRKFRLWEIRTELGKLREHGLGLDSLVTAVWAKKKKR